MEPLNEKSQIAQEYGLLPADARQQINYYPRIYTVGGVAETSRHKKQYCNDIF